MSKSRLIGPGIAILITVAFVIWMRSGKKEDTMVTPTIQTETKSLASRVQYVSSTARLVQQTLTINGVTEATRNVTVRSEASGKLVDVRKSQGDKVTKGDIIARIDLEDLPAKIRQARAFLEQTRLEYKGAQKLFNKGLINEASLAANLTSFEQAKAQLAALQLQEDDRTIKAPISGLLENSDLQVGSQISVGDLIADIYDYSQLKFVGAVAEKDIALLNLDQEATVRFRHGDTAPAKVSYISSVASPATRTFTIELRVPTVDHPVSKITSEATIQLNDVAGHFISPALLSVNDDGGMGIKVLDETNHVQFSNVEILRSETDGVWVKGLGEQARILTVGQGFVNVDDEVEPTETPFSDDVAVGP